MLKLYKFRSLGDEDSFRRAKGILETGKFWCSTLWEQNDPMEGVYTYDKATVGESDLVDIFSQKNAYRICSFSGRSALAKPTMWGYYANGFRGIAIEIRVAKEDVRKMEYRNAGAEWLKRAPGTTIDDDVKRVLTTKLKAWIAENEYRYLVPSSESSACVVGQITGVYFGGPYEDVDNTVQVYTSSKHLRTYRQYRQQTVDIAIKKGYTCYSTGIVNGKVTWAQFE